MDTSKVIRGVVNSGRYTVTAPIVKEDYGLYLQIEGVELPQTYEVDFSNSESNGTSVTMIGNADGVLIPHQFIDTGKDIFAFLYHVGANYGRTVYKFRIPNKVRPDRTNEQPTPEEQSVIDQTIAALNEAAETAEENADKAEAAVEHYPQIVDGTWRVWDVENGQWLDTGIDAEAVDGVSPTVSVSNTNGIHTVTITDANGTKTATIYDGLTIIMLTSSFVIPTDENGVLTQDVRLVAKFRIMRGNTIIDGRVMPNSSITLTNPNAPQLRVVYWREGVSVTDPQTEVTLPSGYKLVGSDSGSFSIKLRVGSTDYVLNPTWSLAKRGEKGEKGDSPTITASKTGKTTSIYVDGSEIAQIEDGTDGTDGISPTVTITPITGGHRITITDADGTETADVMDGHNGMVTVNVTGTAPTITAQADYRYICGEVATLDFTPSASGICDVVFTSGATATVLTVPSTIKWANGFDPTSLEANTTYELNVMDGLGVASAWA